MTEKQSNFKKDMQKMGLAGITAIFAVQCTHPIDSMRVRMQLQDHKVKKYRNLFHGIYTCAKEEGIVKGNYKGIVAASLREGVYRTLALGLYEPIKRTLNGDTPPNQVPSWKKFAAGAMSGCIGSIAGNPLDILKVR